MSPRVALLAVLLAAPLLAQTTPAPPVPAPEGFWARVQAAVDQHLGRPYVWGATGLKSFDCSGFVWRVMTDAGVFIKRSTARKYFVGLPTVERRNGWRFGTIIFFDDLKHCGIVKQRGWFYHAGVTEGTQLTPFGPFWAARLSGFRAMPVPGPTPPEPPMPSPAPSLGGRR